MIGCENLQEIHEIPSQLHTIFARGCASLTLQSASVLLSQVTKEIDWMDMEIPGAQIQIPDWFDYSCEGGLLSFWARRRWELPNAVFAFVLGESGDRSHRRFAKLKAHVFVNGVELEKTYNESQVFDESLVRLLHLETLSYKMMKDPERFSVMDGLERYLVHEWNHFEI